MMGRSGLAIFQNCRLNKRVQCHDNEVIKSDYMALKMSQNSLFAILLRSAWWYSVLIGVVFIALSASIAGGQYIVLGIVSALPFFAIAAYAGYNQFQLPSGKRVLEVAEQARSMPAASIADKIANEYVKRRFDSTAFKGGAADLVLERGNRKLLLSTKRFKAANTGIEPLKKLVAAGERTEATGYLYVTLGDISAAAHDYAKQNNIELIQATELTAFFDEKANIE